jgi:serine/threonine-protein kinase
MHGDDDSTRPTTLERRGDVVGGSYRLGAILGIGELGVVYAAVHRSRGRAVALKLPRPDLAIDPVVREQFRTEALAGARIRHRNVVSIMDFGEDGGVPYLVMEHVVGRRLGDLVAERGGMPVAMAVRIVGQILAGLQAVHDAGIVHSDVRCANILVEAAPGSSAVPRLIDFGFARFVDDPGAGCAGPEWLTAGTPEYLAPDLIRGDAPTFASDVYAAGVLLYKLVTGVTPFAGGTRAQVLRRQLWQPPMPLSWWAPHRGIPTALDEVVGCALAKDPAHRFADAGAFRAALGAALGAELGAAWTRVPPGEPGPARSVAVAATVHDAR